MSLTPKRAAETRPDLPFHDIFDYLIRNWRGPSTEYCAYQILKAIPQLGLHELQAKLRVLTIEQVLEHRWTVEGRLLSDDELPKVLAAGYRHSATGEIVVDAALKLDLTYRSGPALNQLMMFAQEEPALIAGPSAA